MILYNNSMTEVVNTGPFQLFTNNSFKNDTQTKGSNWSKQELIKYAVFLNFCEKFKEDNYNLQIDSWGYFRKLSIFIQSKNPNQCRIFHKRMMSDHDSLDSLISELKSKIDRFEQWEVSFQSSLINMKLCLNRQKDQKKKQLSKLQNCANKIIHPKLPDFSFEKKHEQLLPTDDAYPQEKFASNRPSVGRPSFSLNNEVGSSFDEHFGGFDSEKPSSRDVLTVNKILNAHKCFMGFIGHMKDFSSLQF